MNSKLLLLASSIAMANAGSLTFQLISDNAWTFGTDITLSWTVNNSGSTYEGNIVDIKLYGPITDGQDMEAMVPSAVLATGVDFTSGNSISVTLPLFAGGGYYICATEGTSHSMACTPKFQIQQGASVEGMPDDSMKKTGSTATTLSKGATVAAAMGALTYFLL